MSKKGIAYLISLFAVLILFILMCVFWQRAPENPEVINDLNATANTIIKECMDDVQRYALCKEKGYFYNSSDGDNGITNIEIRTTKTSIELNLTDDWQILKYNQVDLTVDTALAKIFIFIVLAVVFGSIGLRISLKKRSW